MNRREAFAALPALLALQTTPPNPPPQLVIDLDPNYSADPNRLVLPVRIAFRAGRRDTVSKLTAQIIPLSFSLRFTHLVTALGVTNLGDNLGNPGWNYFVNGRIPFIPADNYIANPGDQIEWRPDRRPT